MEPIFTPHVRERLEEREYLSFESIEWVMRHAIETVVQPDGRVRFYARPQGETRYWRVVTKSDRRTVVTAVRDRNYRPPT